MAEVSIEDIFEETPDSNDSKGKKEESIWTDYDKELREQHHKFTLKLNEILFVLGRNTIRIVWFVLMIFFIIWAYHIASPHCWHFLEHEGLQTIERILFSSALISIGGKFFGKFNLLEAPKHKL